MKGREYNYGVGTDLDSYTYVTSKVVELHWDDGSVCQISGSEAEDPRGKGVLIRLWPENGTAEYGGNNTEDFSAYFVQESNGAWIPESIRLTDYNSERAKRKRRDERERTR